MEEFLPVLEAGGRLGAKRVMVCGHDADEGRVTALFAAMCDAAAGFGLGVDIEFMPWLGVKSLAQAERVVSGAGRPNGGILVDALHLHRSGANPADLASVAPRHFHHMQLCDGPIAQPASLSAIADESKYGRRFPGDGALPLQALLRALPAGIPISVETPVAAGMTPEDRAMRAFTATRALLDTMAARQR